MTESHFPASSRESGVLYTKPWMVELVLDLAGYVLERRLAELVALEPSHGGTRAGSSQETCHRRGVSTAPSPVKGFLSRALIR